jgi:hypothetical protein
MEEKTFLFDLPLATAVWNRCTFQKKPEGGLAESPLEAGNFEFTLQEFFNALNAKFQSLVPVGYATSPVFFDWVDLKWYNSDKGQPE